MREEKGKEKKSEKIEEKGVMREKQGRQICYKP